MSHKAEQLASTLQRELQAALARGLADPRIKGLVTITGVELVDEGRTARVAVTVMPEEHEALTLHGLTAAAGHLRRIAGERIRTREMPRLAFTVDRAQKKSAGVMAALAKVREEESSRSETRGFGAPTHPTSGDDPQEPTR